MKAVILAGGVDITALIAHHRSEARLAIVTAVQPPGRYGALKFTDNNGVSGFQEKPQGDGGWINGGFFVLEPEVIDQIDGDDVVWEQEPLKGLAANGTSRPIITVVSGSQWTHCVIGSF